MAILQPHPRITPFLWFNSNAEEAVDFYLSIFKNSRRLDQLRSPDESTGPKDHVLTVAFELDGQRFTALNGGMDFPFTQAISFVVHCDNQQEIDFYWEKLTAGGSEVQCGWLTDKFGLSWQVVPVNIAELVRNPKGMQSMLQMKKLDIAAMQQAASS